MKKLRGSIFAKLVVTFLLVLIPLYMVNFILNREGSLKIQNEITKSVINNNNFYMQLFDLEVSRINQLISNFVADNDLQELGISGDELSSYDRAVKLLAVQRRLQLLKAASNYIAEVRVFLPLIDRTLDSDDFQIAIPAEEYTTLAQNSDTNRLVPVGERLFMSFRYPINTLYKPVFVIAVEISKSKMQNGLLHIVDPDYGNSILYNAKEGWSITDASEEELLRSFEAAVEGRDVLLGDSGSIPLNVSNTKYLIFYKHSAISNATLISYEPEQRILGSLHVYRTWSWVLLAISVLIIILFAYSLFRMIHRPLRRLMFAFRKVEEGNMTSIQADEHGDEFHYVYQRFNMMVSKLDVLIYQVYEKEIRNQRLKLKQLQSQINPHFLYNCFFILKRLIQTTDQEKAVRFALYLGDYFRFITRSASDYITLETEMKHVQNYIDIQKICYGHRIDVELELPDEPHRNLRVPRMVVLPVVENAYKYVLHPMMPLGELWIYSTVQDDFLSIRIEDNGKDMSDAEIENMSAKLKNSNLDWQEATGLLNVHQRIGMSFGADSGVFLSRSQLGGLCVSLRLNLREAGSWKEGDEDHVSHGDRR